MNSSQWPHQTIPLRGTSGDQLGNWQLTTRCHCFIHYNIIMSSSQIVYDNKYNMYNACMYNVHNTYDITISIAQLNTVLCPHKLVFPFNFAEMSTKFIFNTWCDINLPYLSYFRYFFLYRSWFSEHQIRYSILWKLGILWNSTLVLKEDKLSSTTVDFIRSEGNLETKCLYWIRKPKMS